MTGSAIRPRRVPEVLILHLRPSVAKLLFVLLPVIAAGHARAAPAPLVDVRRVNRSIVVELRYNFPRNAFGARLYHSNVALLREPVARRLGRVQARLRRRGLGVKVGMPTARSPSNPGCGA